MIIILDLWFAKTVSVVTTPSRLSAISYPEFSGLLARGLVARRDSGDIEFYYRRISAVKQWKPLRISPSKKLNFSMSLESSWRCPSLTKKPEDSGYEIELSVNRILQEIVKDDYLTKILGS